MSFVKKISAAIVGSLERFFAFYGRLVARNPWKAIAFSVLFAGLCGVGLIWFEEETNPAELWVPTGADFVKNSEWLQENFPPDTRFNNALFEADDVLTPEVFKLMAEVRTDVAAIEAEGGVTWPEVCLQIPVIGGLNINASSYCQELDQAKTLECFETSILELWGYDFDFTALTREEILDKVNAPNPMSVVFNRPIDVESYLDVVRNESGFIVSAKASSMTWIEQVDAEDLTVTPGGYPVDDETLAFEVALFDVLDAVRESSTVVTLYVNVASAADELAEEFIVGDVILLPIGFLIVFVYVMIMLGRFNWVETRALLALVGLFNVGLAILVSYGLCSAFQLFYSVANSVIPFLILGIGIDDMFVILQCHDNLEMKSGDREVDVGETMRRAGVAITVTSITDFVVFCVGASTSLPALRSFCLYCAVAIVAVYFFQATVFVAALSLDLRRIEAKRNGLCPCFCKHKSYEAPQEHKDYFSQRVFKSIYAFALSNVFAVIGIFIAASALLGVAIWGVTQLEVRFEPIWFLPPDSGLVAWFEAEESHFPSDGALVTVYMTDLDYPTELDKIEGLVFDLANATDIVSDVDDWYFPDYKTFVNDKIGFAGRFPPGIPQVDLSLEQFSNFTSAFLFSPTGAKWANDFYPTSPAQCGEPLSLLELTTFRFTHQRFSGPEEHVPAMNEVKDMIAAEDFSANVFATCPEYANWETDEVIRKELFRNLGLSAACIFVATLVLLANLWASVLVMLCVVLTLVDVLGFMYFWGLTIDTVSSINVIISVGLCVDYSVHIAHAFLHEEADSRLKRSVATMRSIGPAVLNGGVSTFIAMSLLAASDSHVFVSFFKVFFLVIVYGLFHGLVFLPLVLRFIGPKAYHFKVDQERESDKSSVSSKSPSNSDHE